MTWGVSVISQNQPHPTKGHIPKPSSFLVHKLMIVSYLLIRRVHKCNALINLWAADEVNVTFQDVSAKSNATLNTATITTKSIIKTIKLSQSIFNLAFNVLVLSLQSAPQQSGILLIFFYVNHNIEIHLVWWRARRIHNQVSRFLVFENFKFLKNKKTNGVILKKWCAAEQVWTSLWEGTHAKCTRVCVHAACLLWQPLIFAFECLEGGAGVAKVSKGKKEESEGLEWRPGGGKSWDWPYLSRGEFVRVCKCKSVCMCDSLRLLRKMKRSVWPGAQNEEVKTGGGGHFNECWC